MDDTYIISNNKDELKEALEEFIKQSEELGLFVNRKKTSIIKLTQWFTYLKVHHRVVGKKVISRPHRTAFVRERRRIKKYKSRFDKGLLSFPLIYNSYLSWKGNIIRSKNSLKNIIYTESLFINLFRDQLYQIPKDERLLLPKEREKLKQKQKQSKLKGNQKCPNIQKNNKKLSILQQNLLLLLRPSEIGKFLSATSTVWQV